MGRLIAWRIGGMIPMLILISIVCFLIFQLQPGEFGSHFLENPEMTQEAVERIRERYGLLEPIHVQYWRWITGIITRGDFGFSFIWHRPVTDVIGERMAWTVLIAAGAITFTWVLALPLGIYSAVHQYSFGDHCLTFIGFIGLAIPNFFLALILMYIAIMYFGGAAVGGLFSTRYIEAPWSWSRFVNLLSHLWVPIIVLGTAGTAGLLRLMRGTMLDVLGQGYICTARAKGLKERTVIYKHALRNTINPFISLLGLTLPALFGGDVLVALVLNLPTMGPLLLDSLLGYDQFVAMTLLLFYAFLLLVGNLMADIALVIVDPRIRY